MLVLAEGGLPLERLITDLVLLGYRPSIHASDETPSPDPIPVAVLIVSSDVRAHAAPWSETFRRTDGLRSVPLVWLVQGSELANLPGNEHLMDDFLAVPYPTEELAARLSLIRHRSKQDGESVIRHGALALDPISYQVWLEDRILDFTYMEYELLKLLIGHPGRVYKREEILSLVWGYDYFGGMRTVDVHIRRLRAKLGQDHAWLVETVRGVGYRLAQVRP